MKKQKPEQAFISAHAKSDVQNLALTLAKHPELDRNYILKQIKGLQILQQKVPTWAKLADIEMPPSLSLEQCSSELTADYKASLCKGDSFTDLTGGFGVDFAWIAKNFKEATYVEQQQPLCIAAQHNFKLLGLHNTKVVLANAMDHLVQMDHQSCIYLDPARRDASGGKIFLLQDCQPDLTQIYSQLLKRCDRLLVKLSPMLDLSLALKEMPNTFAIHVVSVQNECKELLWHSSATHQGTPKLHCVQLNPNQPPQVFVLNWDEEQQTECLFANGPENWLYEPNSSIMKAGAFKTVAKRFGIKKLHPHSHLYTSEQKVDAFPGRTFRVDAIIDFNKQDLKKKLSNLSQANLTIRNFPGTVADLRKKLKLKEGGNTYLFATTLLSNEKVLVRCSRELLQPTT